MTNYYKSVVAAALIAATAPSYALFTGSPVSLPGKRANITSVYAVDRNFNRTSPIYQVNQDLQIPTTAPWSVAWDANNSDVATLAMNSNAYGPNQPMWSFLFPYDNPFITQDMAQMGPGTEGKWATGVNLGIVANFPQATPGNVTIVIFGAALSGTPAEGYDSAGPLSGVAINLTGVYQGFWWGGSIDLAPYGLGVPMPYEGGAHDVFLLDPNFQPLAQDAQICFHAMNSTMDTLLPGTNPSGSTEFQWDDDAPTDYVHQSPGEYYSYSWNNAGGFPQGWSQAAMGFFVGTDTVAEGAFNLEGMTPGCEITGTYDLVAVDANDSPLLDGNGDVIAVAATIALGANGEFSALHPRLVDAGSNPVDRYILSYKGSTFLRKNTVVDFTGGSVTGLSIFCMNGDVDGDNEVGPGDFGMLSAAFGSVPGDSNWDPFADLDCDGEVGPSDFGLLSANFGNTGDDDLTP